MAAAPAVIPSSPVDAVLSRLKGAKRNGAGWMACCPAHEDRTPSLGVDVGDDGRVLLNCFGGCDTSAVVGALGLHMRDLMSPDGKPSPVLPLRRIVETYDYVDADETLLYQVVRFDPKDFLQRKPDPFCREGWSWKTKGVQRVLYRLPSIIEAVALERTIFVVEGEKDVHSLEALGLPATTNAGGAKKWRSEYSKTLANANVVLLPDNDEKGRAHGLQVAASLIEYGAEVRYVELPGLTVKGDVSDWLRAGNTREALEALVASTPAGMPTAGPVPPLSASNDVEESDDQGERLPSAERALDVVADSPVEIRAGIMTAGDLGYFVGEDGAMKSTLALLLGCAIAGEYRFLGRFETVAAPVLIVSEEDSKTVIRNRLEAMCRGHGWNVDRVLSNIHILAKAEVRLTSVVWKLHLLSEIERIQPALVILDPLAELMTGEENSNSEARAVVQTMRSLSGPSGANVLAIHHFGKPAEGKRPGDLIRGASAFRRASRFTYTIEHDDTAHELKVSCLKLSRGEKLAPFVVRYTIDSEEDNRAVWRSARFEYVNAQVAVLDKAEGFVVEQLSAADRLNTSELKEAAKGTGVSGADISRVLKSLEMRRLIDFTDGPKGAKQWGLVCLPENLGNHGQPENLLARQPECLPGNHSAAAFCLPSPFRGKQEHSGVTGGSATSTNTTATTRPGTEASE